MLSCIFKNCTKVANWFSLKASDIPPLPNELLTCAMKRDLQAADAMVKKQVLQVEGK